MSLNSYVTLGRSGLRVSKFCLGTMTFGEDWGFGSNPQESEAIFARFQELGGNFIDTANVYTKGHAEKIIGDYFAKKKSLRNRTVIATKFLGNLYPGDPNGGGASRKAISDQCEQSLRRLQTDRLKEIANELGSSPAGVALAWSRRSRVSVPPLSVRGDWINSKPILKLLKLNCRTSRSLR